jgi:DNA polymerase/3'-5' exonuclease PolX
MDNLTIAHRLVGMARELEGQQGNLYRIRAYRRAAETVMNLERPVEEIVGESGRRGLRNLPGIGSSLSEKIVNLVRTGDFTTLKAKEELAAAG